jgi:excisionase family DNA binding protein
METERVEKYAQDCAGWSRAVIRSGSGRRRRRSSSAAAHRTHPTCANELLPAGRGIPILSVGSIVEVGTSTASPPMAGPPALAARLELLTVDEAAELVKCHPETIRRAYQAGCLQKLPFGSRNVRISPDELLRWQRAGMPTRRAR